MAKYLIHACPKRMWYVEQYLVPSMYEQHISDKDILIYNDEKKLGNLQAFLEASNMLHESAWHIQDDVILAHNFKSMTDRYDIGIVCGFCSEPHIPKGTQSVENMWHSFPCIRIPYKILQEFVDWVNSDYVQKRYRAYIIEGKYDDTLFREYMLSKYPYVKVYNLYPNIVDTIDYLIGGSIINKLRSNDLRATYFRDTKLIEELNGKLQNTIYNSK